MSLKVLNVLQHEGRWLSVRDDLGKIEEQRALRIAEETMRSAESVLLRHASKREGLAGKAR